MAAGFLSGCLGGGQPPEDASIDAAIDAIAPRADSRAVIDVQTGMDGAAGDAPAPGDAGPVEERPLPMDAGTTDAPQATQDAGVVDDVPIVRPCIGNQRVPRLEGAYVSAQAIRLVPLNENAFGILYRVTLGSSYPLVLQVFRRDGTIGQLTLPGSDLGAPDTRVFVGRFGATRKRTVILYTAGAVGRRQVMFAEEQAVPGRISFSYFSANGGAASGSFFDIDQVLSSPAHMFLQLSRPDEMTGNLGLWLQLVRTASTPGEELSFNPAGRYASTPIAPGISPGLAAAVFYPNGMGQAWTAAYRSSDGISTVTPADMSVNRVTVSEITAGTQVRFMDPVASFSNSAPATASAAERSRLWSLNWIGVPYIVGGGAGNLRVTMISQLGTAIREISLGSNFGTATNPPEFRAFPMRRGHEDEARPFLLWKPASGLLESGLIQRDSSFVGRKSVPVATLGGEAMNRLVDLGSDERVGSCERGLILIETSVHNLQLIQVAWESLL